MIRAPSEGYRLAYMSCSRCHMSPAHIDKCVRTNGCVQVRAKLRVSSIGSMTLATVRSACAWHTVPCTTCPSQNSPSITYFTSLPHHEASLSDCSRMERLQTGEQVTSLSQVQDIDQIVVEQALSTGPSGAATGASTSAFAVESSGLMRHRSGVDDADPDSKYGKRKNGGWLSSLLPSEKSSTMLPVTRRCACHHNCPSTHLHAYYRCAAAHLLLDCLQVIMLYFQTSW